MIKGCSLTAFKKKKNKKSINHLPFRKSQMQPPHFQTVFFGTPVSNSEEKDNLINNSMPICNFEQHMVLTFEIQYRRKKEKLKKNRLVTSLDYIVKSDINTCRISKVKLALCDSYFHGASEDLQTCPFTSAWKGSAELWDLQLPLSLLLPTC